MPTQTAKVSSLHFKALVSAVLKFPPSASVSSSEIINLAVFKGRLRASVFGLVEASAAVLATGDGLEPFSVDYRVLSPYAELCPDAPVTVEISKNQVLFTCLEHKLKVPFTVGRIAEKRALGTEIFIATEGTAKTVRWLASIADRSEAKPDTACVYLYAGKAAAVNQFAIAVSQVKGLPETVCALPLLLCAVLAAGDKITQVADGLVVRSEFGTYAVPFLAATLKFPVRLVNRLLTADGELLGICEAPLLAQALKESADCVARIPKTQAGIALTFEGDKLAVDAHSPTADYHTCVPIQEGGNGTVNLPLLESEAAVGVFDQDVLKIKRLEPKRDIALIGSEAFVFFAPQE